MGSLALCKDYIQEDFLLVEGDTFFEEKVVEILSGVEAGNYISMTEESGSGDECFVETRQGFVTKITKDRHRVCNSKENDGNNPYFLRYVQKVDICLGAFY